MRQQDLASAIMQHALVKKGAGRIVEAKRILKNAIGHVEL